MSPVGSQRPSESDAEALDASNLGGRHGALARTLVRRVPRVRLDAASYAPAVADPADFDRFVDEGCPRLSPNPQPCPHDFRTDPLSERDSDGSAMGLMGVIEITFFVSRH